MVVSIDRSISTPEYNCKCRRLFRVDVLLHVKLSVDESVQSCNLLVSGYDLESLLMLTICFHQK
jgi:hypothetical protein